MLPGNNIADMYWLRTESLLSAGNHGVQICEIHPLIRCFVLRQRVRGLRVRELTTGNLMTAELVRNLLTGLWHDGRSSFSDPRTSAAAMNGWNGWMEVRGWSRTEIGPQDWTARVDGGGTWPT